MDKLKEITQGVDPKIYIAIVVVLVVVGGVSYYLYQEYQKNKSLQKTLQQKLQQVDKMLDFKISKPDDDDEIRYSELESYMDPIENEQLEDNLLEN